MSISSKVKIITSAVAVSVAACVVAPLLISSNRNANTIVAMAPITKENTQQSVFVIPPKNNVFEASVAAYAMWEKVNGHMGRPCNLFVPIYANGCMGQIAIKGARHEDAGSIRYNFFWRGEPQIGDIYLKEVPLPQNAFKKINDFDRYVVLYGLLKTNHEQNDSWVVDHPITRRFTIQEIYDIANLNQLKTMPIDYDAYNPNVSYEKWGGRR